MLAELVISFTSTPCHLNDGVIANNTMTKQSKKKGTLLLFMQESGQVRNKFKITQENLVLLWITYYMKLFKTYMLVFLFPL